VINKAIYLAPGINLEDHKELLSPWLAGTGGARFWLSVLTELQNRDLRDIIIAAVDGLTGFPEANNTAYPQTRIQLRLVRMARNSLKFVSWKNRKAVKNRPQWRWFAKVLNSCLGTCFSICTKTMLRCAQA